MNDVMGIWSMFVLSNVSPLSSLMLNIDGVRSGGPAGIGSHRLMVVNQPDTHGPFSSEYYEKWFSKIERGEDFKRERHLKKKTCFDELYFFPLPGEIIDIMCVYVACCIVSSLFFSISLSLSLSLFLFFVQSVFFVSDSRFLTLLCLFNLYLYH